MRRSSAWKRLAIVAVFALAGSVLAGAAHAEGIRPPVVDVDECEVIPAHSLLRTSVKSLTRVDIGENVSGPGCTG
jgi:hypothetical protein